MVYPKVVYLDNNHEVIVDDENLDFWSDDEEVGKYVLESVGDLTAKTTVTFIPNKTKSKK